MIARALFLLLLALNLAMGGWWYVQSTTPPPEPPASTAPPLVLLSEREAEAMAEAASALSESSVAGDTVCETVGPFATQSSLQRALDLIGAQALRAQFQEQSVENTRGYWVYLPAYENRESALKAARQLNAASVRDYYVVTAGDHENTVSLGLFRNRENAAQRQSQIAGLGFPARLEERTEVTRQFWIDYERNKDAAIDISALPGADELTQRARACR
jgi:hypothetical protein